MTCHYRCADSCFQPVANTTDNEYFGDIVRGTKRRTLLKAIGASAAAVGVGMATAGQAAAAGSGHGLGRPVFEFEGTPPVPFETDKVVTPEGFTWKPLVKWGDPIVAGAPKFDFNNQSAAAQEKQFGYNCDYVGLVRNGRSSRGLLVVNNEYTNEELMFRGYSGPKSLSTEQVKIVMAAHGLSVVEVSRKGVEWQAHMGARKNRRITATTPFALTGPAAGSKLVRTKTDPTGRRVLGTFGNCSGGTTPWGTVLSGEENFNGYFSSAADAPGQEAAYKRYGVSGSKGRGWESVDPRFDTTKEPNEVNRFGYIIEVDPTDPTSTPRKHTALGRLKHEGANVCIAADGRVVAYTGDDERFDYLYKFVSRRKYKPGDRRHNMTLLEEGDLYVAKFTGDGQQDGICDGTGTWLPLVQGGKSKIAGMSVEEVLVWTRLAADKAGATKMDRPEDVEPSPVTGKVYVALTNNSKRTADQVDEVNPRASNKHGQVLEITERRGDQTATEFTWKLVLICGDPSDPSTYFDGYDKSEVSPISCPDNVAFDSKGNLWISTDGNALGNADAFFMMPLEGKHAGHLQQFHTVPHGAESAGPLIVDDKTVFCAVQHPGEVDGASPSAPASLFPYDGTGQPRPSVIQVFRDKAGKPGKPRRH
ncbi:PhoX family phosphatase [Yimella sp. cx-51]|nr:PhoX family phosphatase [Yimella sp. cx-51]MBC9956932.1 PhoX family phosphatase [Yimella sp. cx-51]QTH39542.1 PhoX family phosphatase [Yimella sp. cx-51]